MTEIKWLNAVIDIPADQFDEVGEFWVQLTNSTQGEVHPEHDEFVHLLPVSGDMHLELQRINSGEPGVHLDLVVARDEIDELADKAVSLGARLVSKPGHAVLETPGGVAFCIVPGSTESERAPVIDVDHPHAVDQICLDVPHEHFETDIAFWAALTGWEANEPSIQEFRSFAQPKHLPLRILLQQLGEDDQGGPRAHLDLSSGTHIAEIVPTHQAAGAEIVEEHTHWTILTDPSGQPYCLTARQPSAQAEQPSNE